MVKKMSKEDKKMDALWGKVIKDKLKRGEGLFG